MVFVILFSINKELEFYNEDVYSNTKVNGRCGAGIQALLFERQKNSMLSKQSYILVGAIAFGSTYSWHTKCLGSSPMSQVKTRFSKTIFCFLTFVFALSSVAFAADIRTTTSEPDFPNYAYNDNEKVIIDYVNLTGDATYNRACWLTAPGDLNPYTRDPDIQVTLEGTEVNHTYIGVQVPEKTPPGWRWMYCYAEAGSLRDFIDYRIFYVFDAEPVLESVSPGVINVGETVNLTILGKGFGQNPALSISPEGLSCQTVSVSYSRVESRCVASREGDYEFLLTSFGSTGLYFAPQGQSQRSNGAKVSAVTSSVPLTSVAIDETAIHLSTGASKNIGVKFEPQEARGAVTWSFAKDTGIYPGGTCDATVSAGQTTGTGKATSTLVARAVNCSGVYHGEVKATNNATQGRVSTGQLRYLVVVPPEPLIKQMLGAAGDFTLNEIFINAEDEKDPNNVTQTAVGQVAKNRFGDKGFGANNKSWLAFQQQGTIETSAEKRRPDKTVASAANVYTGKVSRDFVGGATCYWSPRTAEWEIIKKRLDTDSSSTVYPDNLLAPTCFAPDRRQIIYKESVPMNPRKDTLVYSRAPAILLVRERDPGEPAVIRIP